MINGFNFLYVILYCRTSPRTENWWSEDERLSTVHEMSHSNVSEENDESENRNDNDSGIGANAIKTNDNYSPHKEIILKVSPTMGQKQKNPVHGIQVPLALQSGSPHPIKNCNAKLSCTQEQQQILSKALKNKKKTPTKKDNMEDDIETNNSSKSINDEQEIETEIEKEVIDEFEGQVRAIKVAKSLSLEKVIDKNNPESLSLNIVPDDKNDTCNDQKESNSNQSSSV